MLSTRAVGFGVAAAVAGFAGAALSVFGGATFAAEALAGAAFFVATFVAFGTGAVAAFRAVDFVAAAGVRASDFGIFLPAGLAAAVALRAPVVLVFFGAAFLPTALTAGLVATIAFFAAGFAVLPAAAGFRAAAAAGLAFEGFVVFAEVLLPVRLFLALDLVVDMATHASTRHQRTPSCTALAATRSLPAKTPVKQPTAGD